MENKKVSIQELVDTIAAQSNFSKRFTENFLRELVSVIQEYLEKDGIVKVKGLGTFKLIWNEERKSINVSTGQDLVIPGHYKVSFTPEAAVKEAINAPYAHLETVMEGAQLVSEVPADQVLGETTPVESEAPVAPVAPVASVSEPSEPEAPAQETPIEPEVLAQETPVEEPATPAEPAEPAEPASPVEEPETPAEPETPVQPEEPAEPQAAAQEPKKKKSKAGLIVGIVIVVLVILVAVIAYFYYMGSISCPIMQKLMPTTEEEQEVQAVVQISTYNPSEGEFATPDPEAVQVEDVYAATGTVPSTEGEDVEEAVEEPKVITTANYSYQDALLAPTREVITVIPGSRLTMIAYRAYGSKDFWVYVYDANRNVLSDPASVEKGMKLRIADLPLSLVNPNDPACLQKAKELAQQYE